MKLKKFSLVVITSIAVFALCSCNAEQKESLAAMINQTIQCEETYTPATYQDYEAALSNANNILEKTFSSEQELSEAEETLQAAIDHLEIKADKSALSALLNRTKTIDEEQYTSASCRRLDTAISYASMVMDDENASQWDVDYAAKDIEDRLEALVVATKGRYQLNYSFHMISNAHVGNEWLTIAKYDGAYIQKGDIITAPLNSSVSLRAQIFEEDSIPDMGSGKVRLPLDGSEKTAAIYVSENAGRYTGNRAKWNFSCSAKLLERI
ncbi:MAG: FIVAR domain-containing protein [Clostridia bacterium]|nr:FIVAR domain-containing protein [Clostridia bacterium]